MIPVSREILQQPSLELDVPVVLSDPEFEIASSWLGKNTPVAYQYEHNRLIDDRNLAWLTREHHSKYGIPLLSKRLAAVTEALQNGGDKTHALNVLTDAAAWWENQPDNWSTTGPHQRRIALAYLELSSPEPVLPEWFLRLAEWDNHIQVLVQLHTEGRTDTHLLTTQLSRAWRYKQDRANVAPNVVTDMFRTLGFRTNGWPVKPPRGALTLFRGATAANRAGTSWTLSPSIASYFARGRQQTGQTGQVWKVTVPASRALAYLPDEQEFIIDLTGFEHLVQEADPGSAPCKKTRRRTRHILKHAGGRVMGRTLPVPGVARK